MINKNLLKLIKQEIAISEVLKEMMGDSIKDLITYRPTLNATELTNMGNANYFITLSCNRVDNLGSSHQIVLKVGVAVNSNVSEDAVLEIFPMTSEINRIVTQHELIFGAPQQFEFVEMEEAYFDDASSLWGYVMLFVTKDANR